MYQSQILIEQELELATIVRNLLKPFLFVTKQLSQESITIKLLTLVFTCDIKLAASPTRASSTNSLKA